MVYFSDRKKENLTKFNEKNGARCKITVAFVPCVPLEGQHFLGLQAEYLKINQPQIIFVLKL